MHCILIRGSNRNKIITFMKGKEITAYSVRAIGETCCFTKQGSVKKGKISANRVFPVSSICFYQGQVLTALLC
jgi:hypothetical protein